MIQQNTKHAWKGGVVFKTPAEEAFLVMDKLAKENNLSAQALVDVSRPEDAVLHQDFEWRDPVAAEEYRKGTARNMINSIVVVHEEKPQQEPVRAFFHITPAQPNYEPVEVIMQDVNKTDLLMQQAMKELLAFRAKYNGLKEFQKLFQEIGRLEQLEIQPRYKWRQQPIQNKIASAIATT